MCREIGTKNLGICSLFLQARANVAPAPTHTVTLKSVDLLLTHRYFDMWEVLFPVSAHSASVPTQHNGKDTH